MAMLNNPRVVPFFGATVNPHEQTDPRTAPDGGTVRGAVREKRVPGAKALLATLPSFGTIWDERAQTQQEQGVEKGGKPILIGEKEDLTRKNWGISRAYNGISCHALYISIYTYPTNTNNMIFAYVWKIGHWPPSCGSNWKKWLRVKVLSFWDLVLISFTTSCSFEAHC